MTTIKTLPQLYQNKIHPLDAELILAHVLKKPRAWVLSHPEYKVETHNNASVHKVIKLLRQRERGVPLAYLTGHKEFFGLEFFVNKNVLIPRPETELMVEEVIKKIKKIGNKEIILIDVGTGSGCIPIAIACHCERPHGAKQSPSILGLIRRFAPRNDIQFFATDISRPALAVARRNAKRHGIKIKFLHGDLLSPFLSFLRKQESKKNKKQLWRFLDSRLRGNDNVIITTNLPYLTPQQFASEPSIRHEPHLALVADNKNGLSLYEKLLLQIKSLLSTLKLYNFITFIEIDPRQTTTIKKIIKKYLPQATVKIKKDLADRERVVIINSPPL